MYVADLSLSRELYTLSKWIEDGYHPDVEPGEFVPRFTAGFLLRKLPRKFDDTDGQVLFLGIFPSPTNNTQWEANYGGVDFKAMLPYQAFASTPENAACSLAIELFKQGILTKEEQNDE